MAKTKVSLVKSENSYQGVLGALKLIDAEIAAALKDKKRLLIKPNFVITTNSLAATPIQAVRAILDFLKPYYPYPIVIAEGATVGGTWEGFQNYGYLSLPKEYNVELFDLNEDETKEFEIFDRNLKPLKIPIAKKVLQSDFRISITRPKTHDVVVATLALKNMLVGSLHERHRIHQGKVIHKNLSKLAQIIPPHLAIIDGTVSMEGEGPNIGREIKTNWAAAGLDFLAVDSLALYLMGIEFSDVGYLYLCQKQGLGHTFPDEVEVVGEAPKALRRKFLLHPTANFQKKWRDGESLTKFQKSQQFGLAFLLKFKTGLKYLKTSVDKKRNS